MPRRLPGTARLPSKFGSWKPRYFLVVFVLFLTVLVLLVTVVLLSALPFAYMETAPKVRAAAAISVISFFIWRFSFGLRSFKIVWGNHSERHMKDRLICN